MTERDFYIPYFFTGIQLVSFFLILTSIDGVLVGLK